MDFAMLALGLDRFHSAQNASHPTAYDFALTELRAGLKRSHWDWFVLPQLVGLGRSAMAQRYGIADLAEARSYLTDPLLRRRLEAVIGVIDEQLRTSGQSLEHLMGSGLDAAKTVSSLTLFEAAGLESAGAIWIRSGGAGQERWSCWAEPRHGLAAPASVIGSWMRTADCWI
jgi:uncharacterized protein (DUF1810 family)